MTESPAPYVADNTPALTITMTPKSAVLLAKAIESITLKKIDELQKSFSNFYAPMVMELLSNDDMYYISQKLIHNLAGHDSSFTLTIPADRIAGLSVALKIAIEAIEMAPTLYELAGIGEAQRLYLGRLQTAMADHIWRQTPEEKRWE